jgi:hypothetical protein
LKRTKVKTILIVCVFVSQFFFAFINIQGISPSINLTPEDNKNWTVMLYFAADTRSVIVGPSLKNSDNFLYSPMKDAMEKSSVDSMAAFSHNQINVIALFDFPYTDPQDQDHANLYHLKAGHYSLLAQWGHTNMGDGNILDNFISYCKSNYPADNYALVLSDHGRGYAGFCYDYHAPHPYWPYALGDCLSITEIEMAIQENGGIDVLVLNTCLGASFELAWQLQDHVTYLVAGESTQSADALHHPREFLYRLSRNPSAHPGVFAKYCYDSAVLPTHVLNNDYIWGSCGLYDLSDIKGTHDTETFGLITFRELFTNFTSLLYDELTYNITRGKNLFSTIRTETDDGNLETSESMMVDLYDLLYTMSQHSAEYHYSQINDFITELLILLAEGGYIVTNEYSDTANLHGFNFCFPETINMYKGFLYPNLYESFAISMETKWHDFIWRYLNFPMIALSKNHNSYWEITLDQIDPSVGLHLFLWKDPNKRDYFHVGHNDYPADESAMGREVMIEGAEFHDDLLTGRTMIRIPDESLLPIGLNGEPKIFEVIIDASCAASATQEINLTARNVIDNEIVWEDQQVLPFEIGQVLSCEVSTNNEMTPLTQIDELPLAPPPSDRLLDLYDWLAIGGGSIGLILIITIPIIVVRRRKRII